MPLVKSSSKEAFRKNVKAFKESAKTAKKSAK